MNRTRIFLITLIVFIPFFFNIQASFGNDSDCIATYDSNTETLHVPCVDLGERYWVDMKFFGQMNNKLLFELSDIGQSNSVYDIADYFPMTAGSEWVYYEKWYDEDDNENDEGWTKKRAGTNVKIDGNSVTPLGIMYSDNGRIYDPWATADFMYHTIDSRGLLAHAVNDIEDDGTEDLVVFDNPINICSKKFKVGDSWTNTLNINGETLSAYFKIVSAGESVNVPAGTFTDTIKLLESTDGYQRHIWLEKNIGVVKTDSFKNGDGGIFGVGDTVLHEYTIK